MLSAIGAILTVLGLCCAVSFAQDAPPAGKYVAFPQTGAELIPPSGFTKSATFNGFEQVSSGASILITRIPGPFSEVTAGFNSERLQQAGMSLQSREERTVAEKRGLLIRLTQTQGGVDYSKWILAFGDAKATFLVTATFPQSNPDLSEPLRDSVLTARPTERAATDAALPFSIQSAKLKKATSLSGTLLYTEDGKIPMKSPEDAAFIVAPSLGAAPVADKTAFAVERMRKTAQTKNIRVRANKPIQIAGLSGMETVADAEDKSSGKPMAVYQVILYHEGGYYLMQGLVGRDKGKTYLPEFARMARSFRIK